MGKKTKVRNKSYQPKQVVSPFVPEHARRWQFNSATGRVQPVRSAEWWRPLQGQRVACDLCYRRCEIGPGEDGWCHYRVNRGGRMELPVHGVISSAVKQIRGYQVDPFLTFKPGALSVFLGATSCTSSCTFCMSTNIVWHPEKVKWGHNGPMGTGTDGGWYNFRYVLHPEGAVGLAEKWGCTQIEFGINEPTLSWEYTYDVARLAKRTGLDVLVETNGFTASDPLRKLVPLVDAVDVGVKGSGDSAFYAKWMRAEGAMDAVYESLKIWRESGTHLIVGDVIAPPQMQTDDAARESQRRFYSWLAEHLGPLTEVLITPMMRPGPMRPGWESGFPFLLDSGANDGTVEQYQDRLEEAQDIARSCGLVYAHGKHDEETIRCHACDGVLLRVVSPLLHCDPCIMATHFCPWWNHDQYVTDRHCDHCGADVPIVTLSAAELAATKRTMLKRAQGAELEQWRKDAWGDWVEVWDPMPV